MLRLVPLGSSLALASAQDYQSLWAHWKQDYARFQEQPDGFDSDVLGSTAAASMEEERASFEIFRRNVDRVLAHNESGQGHELEVNEFADLSDEEFEAVYLGYVAPAALYGGVPYLGEPVPTTDVPPSVDWALRGAVTGVKNQGRCGSCWAFSASGALEGAWQLAGNQLADLSEQQLMDCDDSGATAACKGGSMIPAFKYVQAEGQCLASSYPYKGKKGACKASLCDDGLPKGVVLGWKAVSRGSVPALMAAVAQQPVSVAVQADRLLFRFYKRGVMKGACGHNPNHAVLLVGYGTEKGHDFWKVKNSWGTRWGEKGYVRLLRSEKDRDGECGILTMANFPVVSSVKLVVV